MSQVLKLVIGLSLAAFVTAQGDPYEVCVGLDDGELVGFGNDVSCTGYYFCEAEYGYEEDCATQYGAEFEFNYETNQCDYNDVVQCAPLPEPEPEPEPNPDTPEPETLPPVTQTPATTTAGPALPDVECPTNRPGEIIFFESSDCQEYFICANGNRITMRCMEGFTWNQDEKQCDYPIFSRCSVILGSSQLKKFRFSFNFSF